MKEIIIGTSAESTTMVSADKLASAVGSGEAAVFATPALAALMENAAMKALSAFLEEGETSVGTELRLSHTAATPLGMTVTARAEITAAEGRKVEFRLTARDEKEPVGEGVHTRFVVNLERFVAKCTAKNEQ